MRHLSVLALSALIFTACGDVVTSIDSTKAHAEAEGSIARGWLPEILPNSSISIKTQNNLDLNTSEASFTFRPEEWPSFAAHLEELSQVEAPFQSWLGTVQQYRSAGFVARSYRKDQEQWVFFCKPTEGRCESFTWMLRTTPAPAR